MATIFVVLFRVVTPQLTAYLMLHGGSDAVFWQTLSANALALVLFLIKFDALAPH